METVGDENADDAVIPQVSKNQLKRNRREAHLKNKKKEKKEAEKKKKLEKRLSQQQAVTPHDNLINNASELIPKDDAHVIKKSRKERKIDSIENMFKACEASFEVVIDCAWESDHSDSSLKSLTQQIMFCYGINKRHSNPVSMHLTGLGTRLKAALSKVAYEHWVGVTMSDEDYIANTTRFCLEQSRVSGSSTCNTSNSSSSSIGGGVGSGASNIAIGSEGGGDGTDTGHVSDRPPKQLVYLTSDAEETIETLDPNCAYIIGGIVDRNRLKGVTYAKARAQGLRTAKLPIKENFSLASTHILTVNHVFEILLNFAQCGVWSEAIERVMPKRKGLAGKQQQQPSQEEQEESDAPVAESGDVNSSEPEAAAVEVREEVVVTSGPVDAV